MRSICIKTLTLLAVAAFAVLLAAAMCPLTTFSQLVTEVVG